MKKALIPIVIIAAFIPVVAFAQSLPAPPPTTNIPALNDLTNWIGYLGALVYTHFLTALFIVVGLGLFSMLNPVISGLVILLAIAVGVYWWNKRKS